MTRSKRIPHRYGTTDRFTVGVEEEFQIVDPSSGELVPRSAEMLEHLDGLDTPIALNVKPELMQASIEVATPVCRNIAEATQNLVDLRALLNDAATNVGARIISAGTHPISRYENQQVTEKERYLNIIENLQWIAQRELIFGLHVHVGVSSPEEAIFIHDHIRQYLPHLLAMSVNSPFWQGMKTGLASSRCKVFDAFPRSGVPEAFGTWENYEHLISRAVQAGAMDDYTYVWWDVRPHPRFGTVEIRICDAQTTVEESAALAAVIQSLCAWLGDRFDNGITPVDVPAFLISENRWSAARYGTTGEFINFAEDSMVATSVALHELLDLVEPYSHRLGCSDQLARARSMADGLTGARQQLDVYEASGNRSVDVVDDLIARTTLA